jgi:hypothetical protein
VVYPQGIDPEAITTAMPSAPRADDVSQRRTKALTERCPDERESRDVRFRSD